MTLKQTLDEKVAEMTGQDMSFDELCGHIFALSNEEESRRWKIGVFEFWPVEGETRQ